MTHEELRDLIDQAQNLSMQLGAAAARAYYEPEGPGVLEQLACSVDLQVEVFNTLTELWDHQLGI